MLIFFELLLECHYRSRRSRVLVTTDPSDEAPVTRNECKSLVHSLELLGIVAVNWSKKNYWADVYAKAHGGFQAS
ncbi:hypothetical protein DIPPA_02469 [Diplonema papillatum]|nr:hypothetical protein DIPPA_02469 [Diplonema papillatum]